MPYQASQALAGERASKLGHLEVLKSPLVQKICESFEEPLPVAAPAGTTWQPLPSGGSPLQFIFAVDGSIQIIQQERPPHRAIAFVKSGLLMIDQPALARIDPKEPHPFAVRDLLANAAVYHATALPLRNVVVPNMTVYDAVREAIFESVDDQSLGGEPMETLQWLAYEKWSGQQKSLPDFECPHCNSQTCTLTFDAAKGPCPDCGAEVLITDFLGFHQDMAPDAAPDGVAGSYMQVHETLMLFTGIRYYWQHAREVLKRALFIKDGPLSIRAQYSKLVNPIRRFLVHAASQGYPIAILGQEKSGTFYDHLQVIGPFAPEGSSFLPGDAYIKGDVQHRPLAGMPYGHDTNYGVKVFVRFGRHDQMVLNIPTGRYVPDPQYSDLIAADAIFATLPSLLSARFSGALLPIELVNDVVSLSTYPSARILEIFADATVPRAQRSTTSP